MASLDAFDQEFLVGLANETARRLYAVSSRRDDSYEKIYKWAKRKYKIHAQRPEIFALIDHYIRVYDFASVEIHIHTPFRDEEYQNLRNAAKKQFPVDSDEVLTKIINVAYYVEYLR